MTEEQVLQVLSELASGYSRLRRLQENSAEEEIQAWLDYITPLIRLLDCDMDGLYTADELIESAIFRILGPETISDYVEPANPGLTTKITMQEMINEVANLKSVAGLAHLQE